RRAYAFPKFATKHAVSAPETRRGAVRSLLAYALQPAEAKSPKRSFSDELGSCRRPMAAAQRQGSAEVGQVDGRRLGFDRRSARGARRQGARALRKGARSGRARGGRLEPELELTGCRSRGRLQQ